jgi:hypothetical protein
MVYDIGNPDNPRLITTFNTPARNSHNWTIVNNKWWQQEFWSNLASGTQFTDILRFPQVEYFRGEIAPNLNAGQVRNESFYTATYPYSDKIYNFNYSRLSGLAARNRAVIGNILLQIPDPESKIDGTMASFDISNPDDIRLLDVISDRDIRYYHDQYHIYRNNILFSDSTLTNGVLGIDFSNPRDLKISYNFKAIHGARYLGFKDNFMFTGNGQFAAKYDMEARREVLRWQVPGSFGHHENAFPMTVGHLLLSSNGASPADGNIAIAAHQSGLDTEKPYGTFVNPSNLQTNVAVTSRIAVVVHESLEPTTINDTNFAVRPRGGAPIKGLVSFFHSGVLTFAPYQRLEANTTYDVELIENGIKDVVGNGMRVFRSSFSTGGTISAESPTPVPVVTPVATPTSVVVPTSVAVPTTRPTVVPTNSASAATATPTAIPSSSDDSAVKAELKDLASQMKVALKSVRRSVRKDATKWDSAIKSFSQTYTKFTEALKKKPSLVTSDLMTILTQRHESLMKTTETSTMKSDARAISSTIRKVMRKLR